MKDIKKQIIDYIRRNRVSTTEVADCLGKTGALADARALNRGHFRVGNVFWGCAFAESNWDTHVQIQSVQEGDVVFIEAIDCADRALFGELVSKYLLLYKQAAAIVTNGYLRDGHRLLKENYAIWCKGLTPVGCFNTRPKRPLRSRLLRARSAQYQGALAVCDDTGVVIVPKASLTEEFLHKLEFIEQQEDIWFDCIDRLKWSTYETVCLKNYARTPGAAAPTKH